MDPPGTPTHTCASAGGECNCSVSRHSSQSRASRHSQQSNIPAPVERPGSCPASLRRHPRSPERRRPHSFAVSPERHRPRSPERRRPHSFAVLPERRRPRSPERRRILPLVMPPEPYCPPPRAVVRPVVLPPEGRCPRPVAVVRPMARREPVPNVAREPAPNINPVIGVVDARLARQEQEERAAMEANLVRMQQFRRGFVMAALRDNEEFVMSNLSFMMDINQQQRRVEIPDVFAPLDAEEPPSGFDCIDDTVSEPSNGGLWGEAFIEAGEYGIDAEQPPSLLDFLDDTVSDDSGFYTQSFVDELELPEFDMDAQGSGSANCSCEDALSEASEYGCDVLNQSFRDEAAFENEASGYAPDCNQLADPNEDLDYVRFSAGLSRGRTSSFS